MRAAMVMYRQIYISTAHDDMTPQALDAILSVAQYKNTMRGITGILLYSERRFLQVLEGDKAAVEERFQVICRDPRHTEVTTVSSRAITARDFPHWSMGFVAEPNQSVSDGFFQLDDEAIKKLLGPSVSRDTAATIKGFLGVSGAAAAL